MAECQICGGSGRKFVKVTDPITKRQKMNVDWCLCKKSECISSEYLLLKMMGGAYLPLEEIDKRLIFLPNNLVKSPNLLIQDTDFQTFCLHIKSVIIKHYFLDPAPLICFCKAFDILKNYYVEQNDRSNPQIADLNKYQLLIFTLDTKQKNDQLSTCVHEIVHLRMCACLPTWIYLPKGILLDNTWENSDELKAILRPDSDEKDDKYKKIKLAEKTQDVKSVINQVKRNAESFKLK
jgi:hypothetical protein